MRTNTDPRVVKDSGIQAEGTFGISFENQTHIMMILRDTLYTDKVLAVLREYASNAWDAHRDAGKPDVPIKVTLPTVMEPNLIIRDYGLGMSDDDVFRIYTQYGESTKRDSDNAVGMLGIGSKSGFAYSDSFTVTSWHGGVKRVYVAVLDATNAGEMKRLYEEICGDETGVEIQIPVQPQDVAEFETKAQRLFPYFTPLPEINCTLPTLEKTVGTHGYYSGSGRQGWVAIMGCVPYRINVDQLPADADVSYSILHRTSGALFFAIGDVQVSANREELKYSDSTKKALIRKFQLLQEDYVEDMLKTLRSRKANHWERRIKISNVKHSLKLPVPDSFKEFAATSVALYKQEEAPDLFTIMMGDRGIGLPVNGYTKLVIQDDRRPLAGFYLDYHDFVIKVPKGTDLDAVRKELDAVLEKAKLTGIPIENLSNYTWAEQYTQTGSIRIPNKKHQVKAFALKEDTRCFRHPWSDNWKIKKREPTDVDVYIVMEKFQEVGNEDFYTLYSQDRDLAKGLGIEMPPVYGYKSTEKNPVAPDTLKGTSYREWRVGFFRSQLTPERKKILQTLRWADVFSDCDWDFRSVIRNTDEFLALLHQELGGWHLLYKYFRHYAKARRLKVDNRNTLNSLLQTLGENSVPYKADIATQEMKDTYPLFVAHRGIYKLRGKQAKLWFDYIRMVDRDHLASQQSS